MDDVAEEGWTQLIAVEGAAAEEEEEELDAGHPAALSETVHIRSVILLEAGVDVAATTAAAKTTRLEPSLVLAALKGFDSAMIDAG